jgi:hypothetical protein
MRRSATALVTLMLVLTASAVGFAQPVLRVQGVLHAVDCQSNSVAVTMPDGLRVFQTNRYTAVFAGSVSLSVCALDHYVGSIVTVSLTPSDSEFVAGRIDVLSGAAPSAPPAPGYGYQVPGYPPYPAYPSYYPYYAAPSCYQPYPYYGSSYCYGPYAGYYPYPAYYSYPYYPYYYGPYFGFGFGVVYRSWPYYHFYR